jgi:hypothetical protein
MKITEKGKEGTENPRVPSSLPGLGTRNRKELILPGGINPFFIGRVIETHHPNPGRLPER